MWRLVRVIQSKPIFHPPRSHVLRNRDNRFVLCQQVQNQKNPPRRQSSATRQIWESCPASQRLGRLWPHNTMMLVAHAHTRNDAKMHCTRVNSTASKCSSDTSTVGLMMPPQHYPNSPLSNPRPPLSTTPTTRPSTAPPTPFSTDPPGPSAAPGPSQKRYKMNFLLLCKDLHSQKYF